MGTDGYRVPARKEILGTDGYRVPGKFSVMPTPDNNFKDNLLFWKLSSFEKSLEIYKLYSLAFVPFDDFRWIEESSRPWPHCFCSTNYSLIFETKFWSALLNLNFLIRELANFSIYQQKIIVKNVLHVALRYINFATPGICQ